MTEKETGLLPIGSRRNFGETSSRTSRKSIHMDSDRCMFCQDDDRRKMHNVVTMALSDKILTMAKHDLTMRVRLANVVDLVAAEGNYHLKCLVCFERKMFNAQKDVPSERETDTVLDKICVDLKNGLSLGHVYSMGHVWNKYQRLCEAANITLPPRYTSRRQTFYNEVCQRIGSWGFRAATKCSVTPSNVPQ